MRRHPTRSLPNHVCSGRSRCAPTGTRWLPAHRHDLTVTRVARRRSDVYAGPVAVLPSTTPQRGPGSWSGRGRGGECRGDHALDRSLRRPVRACARRDTGRGELPGPRLQCRRRHPAVHASGPRALPFDVDGTEYVDLVCSLGPDAPRPRAPGGARGRAGGGRPRHVVRHARPPRGRAGRGDRRAHPGREGPLRLVGHRGDHVGDPAGPRVHRARARREVRRLLPRPRRLAAGPGRLRPRHVRGARHTRCPRRLHRRHPGAALQRPGGGRRGVRGARRRDRLRDHRGGAGQHGRRPAGARLQPAARRDLPRARRAVRERRGDDRLPGRPRRGTGASTARSRAGPPT